MTTTTLRPWTDLVKLHPDVESGTLTEAVFAIDLGAIAASDPNVPVVLQTACLRIRADISRVLVLMAAIRLYEKKLSSVSLWLKTKSILSQVFLSCRLRFPRSPLLPLPLTPASLPPTVSDGPIAGSTFTPQSAGSGTPVTPPPSSQTNRVVRLSFAATRDQLFKTFPALANLAEKSDSRKVVVHIEASSQNGFDPAWLRNAVEEPLDEADVERLKP